MTSTDQISQRLDTGFAKLRAAVQTREKQATTLMVERDTLRAGLEQLRDDYVELENAFAGIKEQADAAATAGNDQPDDTKRADQLTEQLADRDGKIAGLEALNRELGTEGDRLRQMVENAPGADTAGSDVSVVKAELGRVRAEYDSLNRSFTLLKNQYMDLQNAQEEAAFGGATAPSGAEAADDSSDADLEAMKIDNLALIAEVERLTAENARLLEAGKSVSARLDGTIEKVRAVLGGGREHAEMQGG